MKVVNGKNYEDYQMVCMDVGYETCEGCPMEKLCGMRPEKKDSAAYEQWKTEMNAIANEAIASGIEF